MTDEARRPLPERIVYQCQRCGAWHWCSSHHGQRCQARHPALCFATEEAAVAARDAADVKDAEYRAFVAAKDAAKGPTPAKRVCDQPGGKKRRVMRKGEIYGG